MMKPTAEWEFPLPRTHTGILQGNGVMGALIWGEGRDLRVTLGRADLWDHRGGMPWTERQNYADIRRCLEANDEPALRKLFETATEHTDGLPRRPSVIPVGRMDLRLPAGAELKRGVLSYADGSVRIEYAINADRRALTLRLATDAAQLCVTADAGGALPEPVPVPAWTDLEDTLRKISFEPPRELTNGDLTGWTQPFPADPGICAACAKRDGALWIVTARGDSAEAAESAARAEVDEAAGRGADGLRAANRAWWAAYWEAVPSVDLPNERLQFLYQYGLYKFGGFTHPGGIAATLQGPWIEEYALPPWSSDYHFNINVQMCYWPAYKANRLGHLKPLFDLVWSWRDTLRANAKAFIGIEDGFMLPHAVDDRCTCMGSFWTGTIDHACTAWVGQMMYDYATFAADNVFLRQVAFPFMKGAMRVYEEMLEREEDRFVLPVSVSPEYRGANMDAWGRNASFQLAAIHRLCENLIAAADRLGEPARPSWLDVLEKLPKATVERPGNGADGEPGVMALWEGTALETSHRHHSHLAAICPFDTIDPASDEWRPVVAKSISQWVGKGMGAWSGWCVPWASMIHSRLDNPDMAELLLEIWDRVFTNEGGGTLHDCEFPGFTTMGAPSFGETKRPRERMQMDAGMGAIVAIQDMLIHSRRGVHYLFAGAPRRWRNVAFGPMRCEGAFRVGAERHEGQVRSVTILAEAGGTFRLRNPWNGPATLARESGNTQELEGDVLEIQLGKGEQAGLRRT
ncbi:MAG: hypothetical protein JXR37_23360 [Kiritimatiellae bacterium]|nr:hypothetical protein [Kiritimatiellia bacterium]